MENEDLKHNPERGQTTEVTSQESVFRSKVQVMMVTEMEKLASYRVAPVLTK